MQIKAVYKPNFDSDTKFPVICCTVPAGVPDFVDDYVETHLQLADFTNNTDTTWAAKVTGESMIDAGIRSGDYLMVDSSVEPVNGDIVVVSVNNHSTVKRLKIQSDGNPIFLPENPNFSPIFITEHTDFQILGVVMTGLHRYRKF